MKLSLQPVAHSSRTVPIDMGREHEDHDAVTLLSLWGSQSPCRVNDAGGLSSLGLGWVTPALCLRVCKICRQQAGLSVWTPTLASLPLSTGVLPRAASRQSRKLELHTSLLSSTHWSSKEACSRRPWPQPQATNLPPLLRAIARLASSSGLG